MGAPWSRQDTLVASAVAVLAWMSRALLRGTDLYNWDSGLLAAGIQDYDFAAAHPHPPFYPLTIALGKLLAPLVGPVHALVWLAVGASALMALGTFAVARGMVGTWPSAGAALLVVLSPTALFNGIAPLSYALEGAASVGLAWTAWRCRLAPSPRPAAWVGFAFGVAVGIRPSALFLLTPLALWAVWGSWRSIKWAGGTAAATGLAWGIPMLAAGGGLQSFLAVNAYQSRFVVFAHTIFQDGWGVVPENLSRLGSYVPWELPFLAAVLVVGATAWGVVRPRLPPKPSMSLLTVWLAPQLAFYVFLYAGWPVFPSGYVMPLVPAFAILCALLLWATWTGIRGSGAPRFAVASALAVTAAVAVLPLGWPLQWSDAEAPMRAAESWSRSFDGLEQVLPPNETAILTFYAWAWATQGHPDYVTWVAQPYWNATGATKVQVAQIRYGVEDRPAYANALDGPDDPPHPFPPGIRRVVVMEDHPGGGDDILRPDLPTYTVSLPSGRAVRVFDATGLPWIEAAMPWFDARGHIQ